MFHRLNRIVLTAGVSVAVIAAMTGPASARVSALPASQAVHVSGRAMPGHPRAATAPGAGPASTLVPVDVTGDITWTNVTTYPNTTGNDTQTGTVHIDLTNVNGSAAVGNSSTYSIADNLSTVSGDSTCTTTDTAGYSGSGSLPLSNTGPTFFEFQVGSAGAQITIQIPYEETETVTQTGSDPGCNGTNTFTAGNWAIPTCYAGGVVPIGIPGNFTGTYPSGTINIGCAGTAPGNIANLAYNITGTLTVTPSCGSAAASSRAQASLAAASSCGLTITSPPDNSTIAATDQNFVDGPQITDTSREPDPSELRLKVAGTSTCQGPVTVNGVSATPNGDNWDALIPLASLGWGSVTLTAKAAGCNDVSSTVTLINLEITKPVEGDSLPITAEPAMPDLNATVSVLGYTGDTSGVTFNWTLDVRGETVSRPGDWDHPYSVKTTGSTTGTGEAWKPSYDQIVGGVGRLTVAASLPGVLGGMVTSFPRWINIPGGPLGKAIVTGYIHDPHADTISQIFCVESRWQQFNYKAVNGDPPHPPQPPIPNVPADWTPNPGTWQPIYGWPAGIGVAQLDPEVGTLPLADYWNWQTNVTDGVALFNEKLKEAPGLAADEQGRLTERRNAAIAIATANRIRKKVTGAPTVPPLITVPQLTDPEVLWEAVKLYNTDVYAEFHFDADYIVSANGLNVDLVGTQQWEGAKDLPGMFPGVPASPAGSWGSMDHHKRAMRWIREHDGNQTYDGQVRVCPAKS